MTAAGTTGAPCQERLRGGAGVVTRAVLVQSPGELDVRLAGARRAGMSRCSAPTATRLPRAPPDAREVASGWAFQPTTLTLQACRRSGDASAAVSVTHLPVDRGPRREAPKLVSVRRRRAPRRTGSWRSGST